MALQHIPDGLVRDLVAEISQGADDSILAPTQVLFGHAHNQLLDHRVNSRSTGASTRFGAIELAGDEPSIPSQNRLGSRGIRHLLKRLVAQSMANFPKYCPRRIRPQQAALDLIPENAVFGNQILIAQQQFLITVPVM